MTVELLVWVFVVCGGDDDGGVYTEFNHSVEKERSAEIEGSSCHGNASMCTSPSDLDVDLA